MSHFLVRLILNVKKKGVVAIVVRRMHGGLQDQPRLCHRDRHGDRNYQTVRGDQSSHYSGGIVKCCWHRSSEAISTIDQTSISWEVKDETRMVDVCPTVLKQVFDYLQPD